MRGEGMVMDRVSLSFVEINKLSNIIIYIFWNKGCIIWENIRGKKLVFNYIVYRY